MTKFDAAALARRDTFTRELGIEVVEAALGRAVTRVQVEERHVNFNGVCHGGLTFTLAMPLSATPAILTGSCQPG